MGKGLDLPSNPSPEQLAVLQEYLKLQQKPSNSGYGTKNHYQERKELFGKKLIIYRNSQKKSLVWYMRFYVGDGKYKILSLRTQDESIATEKALEKWRTLQNHLEGGGQVFETTTNESLDAYLKFLYEQVQTQQLKKHTIQAKRTSLKKLRLFLSQYEKPSSIPPMVLDQYCTWRRTKNWDKAKHHRNPRPPSDLTINKELCDFKGFFDWCKKNKKYVQDIEYPFLKIDWNKGIEKNPSFDIEDWKTIVYYLRTWTKKTEHRNLEFGVFYRKVFSEYLKILANSGLRNHEGLKLRWCDIELKSKIEKDRGKDRERFIAHIQVSPDTKTGRRLVICPAGIYFKRIRQLYRERGEQCLPQDFIFRNIGTSHSRGNQFYGKALSDAFLRKKWYELIEDIKKDKGIEFNNHYTIYSCRAFFINTRLELGVKPHFVAKLVGHSVKTMERHYENIQLKQLEPELVEVRRKQLAEAEFQTYDLDSEVQ